MVKENEKGEKLTKLGHHQKINIANTFFENKPNIKHDIYLADNIKRFKNDIINKFHTGSDHRVVKARLVLNLKVQRIKQVGIQSDININNL